MSQQSAVAAGWHPDPFGAASWRYWDGQAWTAQTGPARNDLGLAPLRSVVGKELELHQSLAAGNDELRAGETRVGILHKPLAGEVTAHSAEGSWLFDRQGLAQNRVGVKVIPAGSEIAAFAWEGLGTGTEGRLAFADGRAFRLARTTDIVMKRFPGDIGPVGKFMSAGEWTFTSPQGAPLVSARLFTSPPEKKTKKVFGKEIEYTTSKREYGTGRTAAQVRTALHPEAGPVVELPLLALLATYCTWWTATIHESVSRDRGVF